MLFWMMPDSGSNTLQNIESFLDGFKKEYPGIDVRVEVFTRQHLWTKLFNLIFDTDAERPDAVEIPHSWTQALIQAGFLENISSLDPGFGLSSYLAPLVPQCYKKHTKDIYAFPWWMDIGALHYRVDHLKEVSKDPQQDLSTWDGLLDVCGRLKEAYADIDNYYPMQNSDWRGSLSVRNALTCLWGRGVDLFEEDYSASMFTRREFADGLEDYINLARYKYMPILKERGSLGTMISGRASMFITRRQGLAIFENRTHPFKVKTLPIPATGPASSSFISGINLVIPKNCAERDNALTFIKWLNRPDNQTSYASQMEVFPSLEDTFDEFIFSSSERMQTYAKIISSGRTLQNILVSPSATKILNEVLDKMAYAILSDEYSREYLERELARAASEADYLLSIYKE
ncbi:ABC-type glycerol-3-phosphate transport system [Parelusimicrobium proximum]|uniref:extracellular solute-binding protein n=1 Tax=Parelusimicrobium proximum TaxID=3228953 RepID=UPI003D165275